MGLDASVRCRCWEEGKCTPPPYADHVRLDEDGYLVLDLDFDGNEAEHAAFENWLMTCCAHGGMDYAAEHIANWTGYRLFIQKLEELGWENFPTLRKTLPTTNGGMTDADVAIKALKEVEWLSQQDLGVLTVLVDKETDRVLSEFVQAYDGVFFHFQDWEAGVDMNGFFIRKNTMRWLRKIGIEMPKRVVFLSKEFEQEVAGPDMIRVRDVPSGRTFTSPAGVSTTAPWLNDHLENDEEQSNIVYPASVVWEQRGITAETFKSTTDALRNVFRGSIETGNPVRWA